MFLLHFYNHCHLIFRSFACSANDHNFYFTLKIFPAVEFALDIPQNIVLEGSFLEILFVMLNDIIIERSFEVSAVIISDGKLKRGFFL